MAVRVDSLLKNLHKFIHIIVNKIELSFDTLKISYAILLDRQGRRGHSLYILCFMPIGRMCPTFFNEISANYKENIIKHCS